MKTTRSAAFALGTSLILVLALSACGSDRWSEEWEEGFETYQPSDQIMDVIGIQPGMVIGEVGAGNGRFAVKVAARVGDQGKVFANDIDPKAVSFMQRRCEREHISNMTVIHSRVVDPGFPKGSLDLVYLINTYDELAAPVTLMRNIRPSLKPNGRLAIIAYDPNKHNDPQANAVDPQHLIEQVDRAGYELIKMDASLTYDNVYLFRLRDLKSPYY